MLTVGVWVRPVSVPVEAHVLFAVRHAVLPLPSEGDLVVAREQESLTKLLLQEHAVEGAEF